MIQKDVEKLKELVPNEYAKQAEVKRLKINGNEEADSLKIAEHFNHYFVQVS